MTLEFTRPLFGAILAYALLPAAAGANTIDAIKTVTWYFDNLPNTAAVGTYTWSAEAAADGGNFVDGTMGKPGGQWNVLAGLRPQTADTGTVTGAKGSTADGEVDVAVDKPVAGDFGYTVTATIHSNVSENAVTGGSAVADSSATVTVPGGMITGDQVKTAQGIFAVKSTLTQSTLKATTGGGGSWKDPVSVSLTDLTTGVVINQDLLEMATRISGNAALSWGAGGFSLSASDDGVSSVFFSLDPLSSWITDPTLVNSTLSFSGGVFQATGIFANLPWAVTPGQVTLPGGFLDAINVPYQVPAGLITSSDSYIPSMTISESAQVEDATPEPATVLPAAFILAALALWVRRKSTCAAAGASRLHV